MSHPLAILETREGYSQHFVSPSLWEPYVRAVCQRHGLDCFSVQATLPGTYPTFFAGGNVVKFFGRLFDGGHSFEVERETSRLLVQDVQIPVPGLRFEGEIEGWRYLVYERIDGRSIGEDALPDMPAIACWVAEKARRIHALPIADSEIFQPTWDSYRQFLQDQWEMVTHSAQKWDDFPGFLLSPEQLLAKQTPPHLIHADLTRDHILGAYAGKTWIPRAIIDFGDARVADIFYELIPLHLDLFDCNKTLLKVFLDCYNFALPANFSQIMMTLTLLFEFDVTNFILQKHPEFQKAKTLTELSSLLWEL